MAGSPSMLSRAGSWLQAKAGSALQWAYDAIEGRGRRKLPTVKTGSEDELLRTGKPKLRENARDLARNFAICSWMIRRHLDYVTLFDFRPTTPDEALNLRLKKIVAERSAAERCDVAARHPLWRILRLLESRAVIDGDCGLLKLADGTLQAIEADRIADPKTGSGGDGEEWQQGVRIGRGGRALAYAIHKRTRQGLQFERFVPASRMFLHGYFDRFDQVRGISPLAAALNPLRDCYENFDLALAKAKVTQLFAIAVLRKGVDAPGEVLLPSPVPTSLPGEEPKPPSKKDYMLDFGAGPVFLDMDPGDDAKFLESQHPSTQFQDFTNAMLAVALKSLDIPISFFDESWTNFFGSRGAFIHYERSCKSKREALAELLHRLTMWWFSLEILDGRLELPGSMTLDDLEWEWTPLGMPWWKPSEEINGDVQAIAAGLTNPFLVCQERGRPDPITNLRETAKVRDEAERLKLGLSFAVQYPPQTVEPAAAA